MEPQIERVIRKSGYGDYVAIDYCLNNKVIETPLYLKKDGQTKIRMRFDTGHISEFEWDDEHCWMEDALIRFDGNKIEVAYSTPSLGQSEIRWWEPTDKELKNKSFIHFK